MLQAFAKGCKDLSEIWSLALAPDVLDAVLRLGRQAAAAESGFHLPDELWARIICDFAIAHRDKPPERGHLLRSLTPLYLCRVASFVIETQNLFSAQVEERIENLCLCFESLKPYLAARWGAYPEPKRKPEAQARPAGAEPSKVEVPRS